MDVTCYICTESYKPEDDIVSPKGCGHVVHGNCLREWINASGNMTCPQCRLKFTKKTLGKIFLNMEDTLLKIDVNGLYGEINSLKKNVSQLQEEKNTVLQDLARLKSELLEAQQNVSSVLNDWKLIKRKLEIETFTNSVIKASRDEYHTVSETLRDQNYQLIKEIEDLKRSLHCEKIKQFKPKIEIVRDTFVDLTSEGDDSDIEIVNDNHKIPKPVSLGKRNFQDDLNDSCFKEIKKFISQIPEEVLALTNLTDSAAII